MPLQNYGVLVGQVLDQRAEGGADSPHFQIRVDGAGTDFRVAVNVLSQQSPLGAALPGRRGLPPPAAAAAAGPRRMASPPLASAPGGLALDFIRGNLFDRPAMRPMPATAPAPTTTWPTSSTHYVTRATADPDARLYAFGQRWGPEHVRPTRSSASRQATASTTST